MTYHVKQFGFDWCVVNKNGNFIVGTTWKTTAEKIAELLTEDSQKSCWPKCNAYRYEGELCKGQNQEGGEKYCQVHGCEGDCPLEEVTSDDKSF